MATLPPCLIIQNRRLKCRDPHLRISKNLSNFELAFIFLNFFLGDKKRWRRSLPLLFGTRHVLTIFYPRRTKNYSEIVSQVQHKQTWLTSRNWNVFLNKFRKTKNMSTKECCAETPFYIATLRSRAYNSFCLCNLSCITTDAYHEFSIIFMMLAAWYYVVDGSPKRRISRRTALPRFFSFPLGFPFFRKKDEMKQTFCHIRKLHIIRLTWPSRYSF